MRPGGILARINLRAMIGNHQTMKWLRAQCNGRGVWLVVLRHVNGKFAE